MPTRKNPKTSKNSPRSSTKRLERYVDASWNRPLCTILAASDVNHGDGPPGVEPLPESVHVDLCSHAVLSVSVILTAARTPDPNVIAAISQIADRRPIKSVVIPASNAPTAYPRSRQKR